MWQTSLHNPSFAPYARACGALGLRVERLREFPWSPYDVLPDMEEVAPGRYQMRRFGAKLPLVYGLVARRPA